MIPWTEFQNNTEDEWNDSFRVGPRAHWLVQVEHGPSMTDYVLNSPMLELAHERRFVVTQQGGDSTDFELDHPRRIAECLTGLEHHFHCFAGQDKHNISVPPDVDHVGLWVGDQSLKYPSSFELKDSNSRSTLTHPVHDRGKPLLVPTVDLTRSRSNSSLTNSHIDIEDGHCIPDFDKHALLSRVLTAAPRAHGYPKYFSRAERPVRLRKKHSSKAKRSSAVVTSNLKPIPEDLIEAELNSLSPITKADGRRILEDRMVEVG